MKEKKSLIIAGIIGIVCICVLLANLKIETSCKNIYLISEEEFIKLYGFTEDEIAEYDIQEFLEAYPYTRREILDIDSKKHNSKDGEKNGMLKKIKRFFSGDEWRYSTLTPGERKEFMGYDNIRYVIYCFEDRTCGYEYYYYVFDLEYNEAKMIGSGIDIDYIIPDGKKEEVISVLEEAEVLDYPELIVFDERGKISEKLALIYDNREHVCFQWISKPGREDYGDYIIVELIEVLITPDCVRE